MNWTEVIKAAFDLFKRPTGLAVLGIMAALAFLICIVPLLLVTGAFLQVGDKVVSHMDQGFDRMERILERREVARK